jgi:hypothetical protein
MSLRSLAHAWNRFFFEPVSPIPIALFRIVFSLVVLADILLLRPAWLTWFGPHGLLSIKTMHELEPGVRINLFPILPNTDFWTNAVFWALLASTLALCAGLFSRVSSVLVFVLLASIQERNLYITNAGDTLLRVSAFFLMFAPAGAALSVDRLRRIWRGREGPEIQPRAPWAQRMIQIELSLLYLMTFWNKSLGPAWVDGTALYYVYHLNQFHRFPVPGFLQDLFLVRLETWFTLAVEFSLGVLVWFKELRYYILGLGLLLHLSLEYTMNVPMFQWNTMALYVTFLEGPELARFWARIRSLAAARMSEPVVVSYDPSQAHARQATEVLQALDIFGRLRLVARGGRSGLNAERPGNLAIHALQLWGLAPLPRPTADLPEITTASPRSV